MANAKKVPVLRIPTGSPIHDFYCSPSSSTSSIPSMNSMPQTPDDIEPVASPKSVLTFAAVWDPLDGMLTMSGDNLLASLKTPIGLSAFHDQDYKISRAMDGSGHHRIRPHSKEAHHRDAHRLGGFEGRDSRKVSPQINTHLVSQPTLHRPQHRSRPELATPSSALTFAAVWDPEYGMSSFTGSRLLDTSTDSPTIHLKPLKSPRSKSQPRSRAPHPGEIPPMPSLPVYSNGSSHPSLPLHPNEQRPPRTNHMPRGRNELRSLSPLSLSGVELPFPTKPITQARGDCLSVDDEGFFDTFRRSDHPDCDPHLPSRFSTTTTSTSNYIDVDFSDAGSAFTEEETADDSVSSHATSSRPTISPPFQLMPVLRRAETSPTPSQKLPTLARSYSSPSIPLYNPLEPQYSHQIPPVPPLPATARCKKLSRPRMSHVLGKLRRHSEDEGWVNVEVTSVITDRMLNDD